jgi:NAD(P)-dependent dehydrogenase (short-subunit alcohol dehydrogenase family)
MANIQGSVVVVTGANSGIGRATALHLASLGARVFGTVRSMDSATKLRAACSERGLQVDLVELDVTNSASVESGLVDAMSDAGLIDVLVNNAGIGGNGVVEEASIEQYEAAFDVNVSGAIRCIQQVLPQMRERRAGTIVNVTSVVGRLAAIAQAPYVASKWALEGVSEELAHEVASFGIRVAIVEPGVTKSSIFAKNIDAPNATGAYDTHYRRMFQFYAAGIQNASPADEVARVIAHAIETDQPRLRYACSWGGESITSGRRAMSDEDFVALGGHPDDAAYYQGFRQAFGVDLDKS